MWPLYVSTLCVTTLIVTTLWEHSMCGHSMWASYVGPFYVSTLCVATLCEHSMSDHSMWALYVWPLYVWPLYVWPLYVSTLCVTTLWEHSMCGHSMWALYVGPFYVSTLCVATLCVTTLCEYSMCGHSMWALYVWALCVSTLCVSTLCVSILCVTTLMCDHSMLCEDSMCGHSMCEHSMCDHSMWALQFLGRMLLNTEQYENYHEKSTSVLGRMLQRQKRQKSTGFIVKALFKSIGEHRKVRELPRKMNIEEVEEPKKYENLQKKPVLDPFKSTADTRKVRELPRKMNIEEVEEPETTKIYRQNPRASARPSRKLRKFTDETNMQARNHENSDEICAQPVRHLDLATPAFYYYRKNPKCYHTVWGKTPPHALYVWALYESTNTEKYENYHEKWTSVRGPDVAEHRKAGKLPRKMNISSWAGCCRTEKYENY